MSTIVNLADYKPRRIGGQGVAKKRDRKAGMDASLEKFLLGLPEQLQTVCDLGMGGTDPAVVLRCLEMIILSLNIRLEGLRSSKTGEVSHG